VRVDHRDNWQETKLCSHELVAVPRCLFGGERVDHQPPGVATEEGDVGDVVTTDLVDVFAHFEETVVMVQLGVTPQAGVHGVGGWVAHCEEGVIVHVDDRAAIGVHDVAGGMRGDEPPSSALKVPSVGGDRDRGVARLGVCGRWFVEFGPRHGASHIDEEPTLANKQLGRRRRGDSFRHGARRAEEN
jgi:hypothetical protein